MNKNKDQVLKFIMYIVIAILCVALAIIMIIYLNTQDSSGSEKPRPNFSFKTIDDIKFDFTSSEELLTDDGTLDVSLTTDENSEATCRYNIVWEWEETLNTKNQYKKDDYKSFTISGNTDSDSFNDIKVNSYHSDNRVTVLKETSISVSGNKITMQKWNLQGSFHNENSENKYLGHITVKDVVCTSK